MAEYLNRVAIPPHCELRWDGQYLEVWYKGDRRVYVCDVRLVDYDFTRARILGGEYLSIHGQARGDNWMTKLKADDVDAVKAFLTQVFASGRSDG